MAYPVLMAILVVTSILFPPLLMVNLPLMLLRTGILLWIEYRKAEKKKRSP